MSRARRVSSFRYNPYDHLKVLDLGTVGEYGNRVFMVKDAEGMLGYVGRLTDENLYPGNPRFYVSPISRNPFDTASGTRQFHNRAEGIAWLMGIRDATASWLTEAKRLNEFRK